MLLKLVILLLMMLGQQVTVSDHYGIDQINTAASNVNAATAVSAWTRTPSNGQEWLWKKYEFIDKVEEGSNNIFAKTNRAHATFIIAGNDVARIIRQMGDHFVPASDLGKKVPTGPMVIGTLDGRTVVQDPFISASRYILGFKADNYLFAGFIFAPYIPLFATPTLVTSDLQAQKGFLSSAGYKVINNGMFTYGTISGGL